VGITAAPPIVVGRLVEVLSGQPLSVFFEQHILAPLGMVDTAFHGAAASPLAPAEAFPRIRTAARRWQLLDVSNPPNFESAGGGLVSTATITRASCRCCSTAERSTDAGC